MHKNKKLWIFGGLIIIVVVLNQMFGFGSKVQELLGSLNRIAMENPVLAYGIFIVLTVIGCAFLAIPGITYAVAAGAIFGPIAGTICCSVATTLGSWIFMFPGTAIYTIGSAGILNANGGRMRITVMKNNCIHCHVCQEQCGFLKKIEKFWKLSMESSRE